MSDEEEYEYEYDDDAMEEDNFEYTDEEEANDSEVAIGTLICDRTPVFLRRLRSGILWHLSFFLLSRKFLLQ